MTTIGEKIYLEQKIRDENNKGCIAYREARERHEIFFPKTAKDKKYFEELAKKSEQDRKLGYESKRFDHPEYVWKMVQDGKTYLRSSCNNNVYDASQSSVIVGTWNEILQRIELNDELIQRIKLLEDTVFKLRVRLEELNSE